MYDYREAMTEDVKEWIKENIDLTEWTEDREGLEQQLNDDLWTEDSITGNASGSYYCNSYKAEESIAHNWDLLNEALDEFGQNDIRKIIGHVVLYFFILLFITNTSENKRRGFPFGQAPPLTALIFYLIVTVSSVTSCPSSSTAAFTASSNVISVSFISCCATSFRTLTISLSNGDGAAMEMEEAISL